MFPSFYSPLSVSILCSFPSPSAPFVSVWYPLLLLVLLPGSTKKGSMELPARWNNVHLNTECIIVHEYQRTWVNPYFSPTDFPINIFNLPWNKYYNIHFVNNWRAWLMEPLFPTRSFKYLNLSGIEEWSMTWLPFLFLDFMMWWWMRRKRICCRENEVKTNAA